MEIYSPKKFRQAASFSENTFNEKNADNTAINETIKFSKEVKPVGVREKVRDRRDEKPGNGDRKPLRTKREETLGARMKRVFYERLRAFFEYEEVV